MTTSPSKGSLAVIFLTVFIDLLGFGLVLPLLPIYADQFFENASPPISEATQGMVLGLLMASFSAMQFIFAPMWGRLSDRIGRRPVLMVGLGGSVAFYTLFGIGTIWQSLPTLFVARIGAGIAGATISTAQAYIADVTTLEKRAGGMALIGAAFGMGFTFGPLLGYLAVPSGHGDPGPWPGYAAAILSGIALLMAIFALPESRTPDSESAAKKLLDFSALRNALATPTIGSLLISLFVCIMAFGSFEATLSLLIHKHEKKENSATIAPGSSDVAVSEDAAKRIQALSPFHFDYRGVCLTYAFIGVTLTIAQGVIVRRLSKKVPERIMATIGGVFEIIGFLTLVYAIQAGSGVVLFIALVIIVVGFSFMMPSLNSLISRRSDPSKQGSILGVAQSMSALARILGPMAGIPLLKRGLTLPYLGAAGLMGVGLLLVVFATQRGGDFPASK